MRGCRKVGKDQLGEGLGFYSKHNWKPLEAFKHAGDTSPTLSYETQKHRAHRACLVNAG